jgi:excisionase family DNA binding protein
MMGRNSLTVTEAAELTGYSEGHVRWLIRNGRIEAEQVGKRVYLIDRESLMEYAGRMEELGTKKHARR